MYPVLAFEDPLDVVWRVLGNVRRRLSQDIWGGLRFDVWGKLKKVAGEDGFGGAGFVEEEGDPALRFERLWPLVYDHNVEVLATELLTVGSVVGPGSL